MYRFYLISILTILILSCSKENEISLAASDWYPLEVGNYWTYELIRGSEKTTLTVKIESIKKFNEKNYFEAVTYHEGLVNINYIRISDNEVRLYNPNENIDRIFLNLNRIGETWESSDPDLPYDVVYSIERGIQPIQNYNLEAQEILYFSVAPKDSNIQDGWISYSFGKNIGLIYESDSFIAKRLVEAKINDVTYKFDPWIIYD